MSYSDVPYIVITIYDWVLLLPREIQMFIAGDAKPLAASLYFATRYSSLLGSVFGAGIYYSIYYGSLSVKVHSHSQLL